MTLTCRIHDNALGYTSIGKPNPFVFRNAEMILKQLQLYSGHHEKLIPSNGHGEALSFKTLYMVGDNPAVDIKDARQDRGFQGKDNHSENPADLVVHTVAEVVDYILKTEALFHLQVIVSNEEIEGILQGKSDPQKEIEMGEGGVLAGSKFIKEAE
ncbi:hypothetical protein RJ641_036857, partial [Dillenia turbinata]